MNQRKEVGTMGVRTFRKTCTPNYLWQVKPLATWQSYSCFGITHKNSHYFFSLIHRDTLNTAQLPRKWNCTSWAIQRNGNITMVLYAAESHLRGDTLNLLHKEADHFVGSRWGVEDLQMYLWSLWILRLKCHISLWCIITYRAQRWCAKLRRCEGALKQNRQEPNIVCSMAPKLDLKKKRKRKKGTIAFIQLV